MFIQNHPNTGSSNSSTSLWPNVFRGLDSRTELADWTHAMNRKQLLNNNPDIIHILQHWRHHYRATTADTALLYKLTNYHVY